MALALVAGATASVVIEKLISTAVSYVQECGAGTSAMQDEIQRLRQAFLRIRTILDLVERGQTVSTKQNDVLDDWLWLLRDAVDQAEDVFDEMEYYEREKAVKAEDNKVQQGIVRGLKRKYDNFASNSEWNSREKKLGEKLREAMKALDHVAASCETILQLVLQLYNSDVKRQQEIEIRNARETSSILIDDKTYPEDKIYGRDTERERIVEWLTKPTTDEPENSSATVGKVSALAIVGMGGMGKTTLAKLIYNDEKVQQCFNLPMWVCVSDQFDVLNLTRKILKAAKVSDSHEELDPIQKILKEKLISKKFLLVLDDVWTDKILEWEKLVLPLKFGQKGSKILLTTRIDSVANTVRQVLGGKKEEPLKLSGLNEDDFKLLFNKHAFAGENMDNHRDLKLIGEQIAKKLGGCPLAAKILGNYLNSYMDEKHWRRILNENFLNLQESEDNIRMILRLSYHHLPASLQICFRYCSIFPKDHEFKKKELIQMWIGSGLIKKPTHGNRSLEDIGEEYLNHLVRKFFFDIKIYEDKFYTEYFYVMHDLLHDLAQFVSSGECLGIEGDVSGDIPETIRHIYVAGVNPSVIFLSKKNSSVISHLKNLRTLIVHLNKDYDVQEFNDEVLKRLKGLRLLRVTAYNYERLDEVGNLIHLRYLSLSVKGNKESSLPQSVCRLHHLEIMELSGMFKIDDSTLDGMSNLVKLRLLDIPHDKMDKIPRIGKLTSLQKLGHFHVREEGGYKIDQLKNLQNLRKLGIRDLENVMSSEEAADANLIEKKNLDKLSLVWSENLSGGLEEPILDNLRPHTNLKELTIEGYAGVRSPYWMTATSLSNIRSIELRNCERWEDLPSFGQLPLLKFLKLKNMQAVKKLWCSGSVGGCAFPSLLELQLGDMPDLESFEGEHMFPLLNELDIRSCPRLKGLPALPLTLSQLNIKQVGLTSLPMMQQDCSSSEGGASCSSSHLALSELEISECPNLTSLEGFMLQQQYFPALAKLCIGKCENLMHLPENFFQKLSSLVDLTIRMCPNLIIRDNRLPETLESLTRLDSLAIDGCASVTSLPPAEVFPRLSKLYIRNCKELSSLNGLQALPSLKFLYIEGCDKLIEISLLQPPSALTSTSHTDMVLRPSMEIGSLEIFPRLSNLSILNCKELSSLDGLQALPSLISLRIDGCDKLNELSLLQPPLGLTSTSHTDMVLRRSTEHCFFQIDRQALLRLEPLRNLNFVSYLTIHDGTELTTLEEQWLLQNRNSLQSLVIHKASSLESLPPSMINLRFLRELKIHDAPLLQAIPELPASLQLLVISGCRPELKEYMKGSGNFDNIPHVVVNKEFLFEGNSPWLLNLLCN